MKVGVALVIGMLVVTAVAGYFAYSAIRTPPSTTTTTTAFSFNDYGNYSWVAQLAPNELFNTTNISGGNSTLFIPITLTINASFQFTFVADHPVLASYLESSAVVLESLGWTKVVNATTRSGTVGTTTRWTFQTHALFNVTQVVALRDTIDNETGASPYQWSFSMRSTILGGVSYGKDVVAFSLAPTLKFNVTGSTIQPTGLTQNGSGAFATHTKTGGTLLLSPFDSYLFLAIAAVGLVAAVWWWQVREEGATTARQIELLTGPYSEIIVRTRTPPKAEQTVRLAQWEDLVKVADTSGKPILRLESPDGRGPGRTFIVLDGTVAYVYEFEHPARGRRPMTPMTTRPPPRPPTTPARGTGPSSSAPSNGRGPRQ